MTEVCVSIDGPLAEDLVAPVVLGMKARNSPKIVALCIGSMQRLVSLRAVSEVSPSFMSKGEGS